MTLSPPLNGLKVMEFAGLAPGPFAGMMCADFGATVLRIDRAQSNTIAPTPDTLTRRKHSICVNTKRREGVELLKAMIPTMDILIEPFRPGVMEKMGLGPEVLMRLNPRLIYARMTGFRRDGKYASMAGHDINYIAVSGALSMLGRKDETPYAPGNILGDFGGGGLVCFLGIVLAVASRERTGYGQVVEANMVDGAAYLATMPRLSQKGPSWSAPRGTNLLDGGAPFYDTYVTKDGGYMAVGALEPQFFAALLKGLEIDEKSIGGNRLDKKTWEKQKKMYTDKFKSKTRAEWEKVFDGTDACCTPILTNAELEKAGFDHRPIVHLNGTPAMAIHDGDPDDRPARQGQGLGIEGSGWDVKGLKPGDGGEEILAIWMGWQKGRHYVEKDGGYEHVEAGLRPKI
ncbi:CoA-transferase family III domain-containing protein [Neohortaea acidophila]|uniref:CoA-transferase family III domain-containing protein n=1 Tax=Neohortaea acidophila TaxID=245834 RepID=A0A6A6PUL4_9PEZI|nr:CoA-transferase family III domain-containing protein [Neohortaea acidophila]KAF2483615.1 CoA-transferase family III domain-containing protein [Neohortaea acidophila]